MGRACHAIFISFAIAFAGHTAYAEQPRLQIEQAEFDFGVVDEGTAVKHDFQIRNAGDADLRIERLVPGCQCTVPALASNLLAPGEAATVRVEMNTQGFSGPIERSVRIFSNDKEQSVPFLSLKGEVRPQVSITPAVLDFGELQKTSGSFPQEEVVVRVREGSQARISKIKSFSKNLVLGKVLGDSKEKRFTVGISPSAPPGELRERVIVGIDSGLQGSVNVPVFAVVTGALKIKPAVISLGILEGGEIVRRVRVENKGSKPVNITKVSSSDSAVQVSYRPLKKQGKLYELEVRVDPAQVRRDLRAAITVETDLEGEPALSLGVYGIKPGL